MDNLNNLGAESEPVVIAKKTDLHTIQRAGQIVLERARRRTSKESGTIGLSTGFCDFDVISDGLEPGDFIIITSRPGMGKTALVLQICTHVAVEEKKSVLILGFNDGLESITRRIVSIKDRINIDLLRYGHPDTIAILEQGISSIGNAPIFIDAICNMSFEDVLYFCRAAKVEIPDLALILIDDLQELLAHEEERLEEIEVSMALKELAEEAGLAVIATCQLPPSVDRQPNKRPRLRDLRQWGRLYEEADVICALYRESYYNPGCKESNSAELILLKNSKSCRGTIELLFDRKCPRFREKGFPN